MYRVYYGQDYIYRSVEQILQFVDKVVLFHFERPWFDIEEIETADFLKVPISEFKNRVADELHTLCAHFGAKVAWVKGDQVGITNGPFNTNEMLNYVDTRFGGFDTYVVTMADYVEADTFGETLREFEESDAQMGTTRPWRMWKEQHRLTGSDISRIATMLFKPGVKARTGDWPFMGQEKEFLLENRRGGAAFYFGGNTFDYGFDANPHEMYWKLGIRRAQADLIPDIGPIWEWYHHIWSTWTPETNDRYAVYGWCAGEENLGSPDRMPFDELPWSVRKRYARDE